MRSSQDFSKAQGVDIHKNFAKTKEFLALNNVENYELFHRDDIQNIPENSVDFIYSFIVFQHFDSFEEVKYYLNFIKRVLKDDGVAHIFFARHRDEKYDQDIKEVHSSEFYTRACSLFMKSEYFFDYVKEQGFEILEAEAQTKKFLDRPNGPDNISGQARVLFKNKQLTH